MSPTHSALTPLKIVVVDGNVYLRNATVDVLGHMGHDARGVASGDALDKEIEEFALDFLVIDLPGAEGLSLARRMRASHPDIGIIILAAQMRVDDKVAGYQSGADFYLTKPVSLQEFGAAIDAVARRLRRVGLKPSAITLNLVSLQLSGPLGAVDVSRRESALLRAFMAADEQLLDTAQIQSAVGKTADEFSKATLEVQIVRLRKKLEAVGAAPPTIKSVRSVGYQLCVPLLLQQPIQQNQVHHHV
jgi:DNA-binding response OmpR family regulator